MTDLQKIRDLALQLEQALRFDPNDAERGELVGAFASLGLTLNTFLGRPYEYGVPGSDPNVEQLGDGRLRITLIQPVLSGTERIEALIMRPSTVGDQLQAQDTEKTSGSSVAALAKLSSVLTTEAGRAVARAELKELIEEDSSTLLGAITFLAERFRRTRKVFRTS